MVLSIFFLGLSFGSILASKYIHKLKRPLLTYGIIEGLIGVYSFFLIYGLLNFQEIMSFLPLGGGTFSKFFLVFLFLLPPTIGMGSSLPVLVHIFSGKDKSTKGNGKNVSILYGVNTLGAAFGAFLSGFAFIPNFGVLESNHLMAALNIAILAMAYFLDKKLNISVQTKTDVLEEEKFSFKALGHKGILLVCAACGFSSLTIQVVWNKYLGIYFGTNIYGLGLILSIYLSGMAIGSFVLSLFIEKITNKKEWMAKLVGLNIIAIFITSYLLNELPVISYIVHLAFGGSLSQLTVKALSASFVLIFPTILFGALLPLAIHVMTEDKRKTVQNVGFAYSINTFGSIIGSYLAGLYFLPNFGSSATANIAIAFLALSLLIYATLELKSESLKWRYSIASIVMIGLVFSVPSINFRKVVKSAYLNYTKDIESFEQLNKQLSKDSEDFKMIHEGETAITSLSNDKQDGEDYKQILRLKTNGLNESVYYQNALDILPKYEALLGLLPYLFTEAPQKAFIVGYGGGYTVDLMTKLQIPLVHVVELEEGIIKAAQYVYKGDNPVLKRPNLKLEIEDARYALTTMQKSQYDIIVSQPSHSWLTGVANLFTQEYFNIVKNNLTNKGIFSQWLNLYNMDEEVLVSILKSFYTVFPEGIIFTDHDDDELIMLGSKTSINFNEKGFSNLRKSSRWRKVLSLVPIETKADFFTNFSVKREDVWEAIKDAPLNTDINAYAEVRQSKIFYKEQTNTEVNNFFEKTFKGKAHEVAKEDSVEFTEELIWSYLAQGKYQKLYPVLDNYTPKAEKLSRYKFLGKLSIELERYSSAIYYLSKDLEISASSETLNDLLYVYKILKKDSDAQILVEDFSHLKDSSSACYLAQIQNQNVPNADDIDKLLSSCDSTIKLFAARNLLQNGQTHMAINLLESYKEEFQYDTQSLKLLVSAYLKINQLEKAQDMLAEVKERHESEERRIKDLAEFYRGQGLEEDASMLEGQLKLMSRESSQSEILQI
jgi:spermidine synthase